MGETRVCLLTSVSFIIGLPWTFLPSRCRHSAENEIRRVGFSHSVSLCIYRPNVTRILNVPTSTRRTIRRAYFYRLAFIITSYYTLHCKLHSSSLRLSSIFFSYSTHIISVSPLLYHQRVYYPMRGIRRLHYSP